MSERKQPTGPILPRLKAQWKSWFRATTNRAQLEQEMSAELAHHLELLTEDLVRAGIPRAEAQRRARVALGSPVVHKDAMRASLGLRLVDDLAADIRYAARRLRRSVGFTAIAAVSLALAIGANSTIFSLAKQLLYARLAAPHPEQLQLLRWEGDSKTAAHDMWGDFGPRANGSGMSSSSFTYPVYQQLKSKASVLQDIFAFKEDSMNATIRGEAQLVNVDMVSGNFYSGMQVVPQLGRAIEASDDAKAGSGAVAVISDRLWERAFARSPAVLGQIIKVNEAFLTVVGVNPQGFTGAKNVQASPDIFVPMAMQPVIDPKRGTISMLEDRDKWWVNVMGRLKPGVTQQQAQTVLNSQLSAAVRATVDMKAGDTIPQMVLVDGSRGMRFMDRVFKNPVRVLMAFTGLVLLLACANIANLMLARGAQRQREMSVRLALGAGRARILRQLLTESLVLASLGGLGGLVIAFLGRNVLPSFFSNPWEDSQISIPFDWTVFGFTAAITVATGILFGFAPAWIAGRAEVSNGLQEGAQTSSRRRKGLSSKSVVAFQIALSTLLVIGAGLFLRTLLALNSVDVGFDADRLLLFEINPPQSHYSAGKDIELHHRLEEALAAVPGVDGVTPGWQPYIADSMSNGDFLPEGEPAGNGHQDAEDMNAVGNTFFDTMRIGILEGRGFGPQDTRTSNKVAVINQALARKRFLNQNPIGKRFKGDSAADAPWITIVGICRDTRLLNLRDDPPPQFFVPYIQQKEVGGMTYQLRTHISPAAIVPSLRRVVQSIDPDLPMVDVRTQREQINANMQMERTFASMTVGFGVLALALASVGIYGVMAYSVANRTNEIGIRLALGAQPRAVLAMILRESTWVTLSGVITGVGGALLLARLVKSMMYGLQPTDPLTLVTGAALLIAVGLAASWLPARRASHVEPVVALRHE
jgi:predicted permease